jgi:hypothetical protein
MKTHAKSAAICCDLLRFVLMISPALSSIIIYPIMFGLTTRGVARLSVRGKRSIVDNMNKVESKVRVKLERFPMWPNRRASHFGKDFTTCIALRDHFVGV